MLTLAGEGVSVVRVVSPEKVTLRISMVLLVLLYASLAIFLAGNVYRIVRVARMPVNLRWELYPIPRGPREKQMYGGSYFEESDWWTKSMETNRASELGVMLQEIFLLKGVWAHFRKLWLWSWLLHVGLYALIGTGAVGLAAAVFGSGSTLEMSAQVTAWVAVVAGLVGALGLVAMRLVSLRLRPFTSRGHLLNLGVIVAIFATGLAGLLLDRGMVASMIGVVGALAGRGEMPVLTGAALAHIGVVAAFLAYFPFTQMTHLYMKYFAYHEVRWDDAPSARDPRAGRDIAKSLEQGVSWAGTHIGSDGRKSWAEIVTPKGSDVEQKP